MLPKHLLPKALGGDVGDDDVDLDDGNGLTANKKNMLSTMKKIKNKFERLNRSMEIGDPYINACNVLHAC